MDAIYIFVIMQTCIQTTHLFDAYAYGFILIHFKRFRH